ncbi:gliding motility-associated C-terminal domain-containing protein, partial [Lutibacter sp.]|uniref:T9SS type B sorting domain-containing protein n=1 Tax=Lutibacter sp. TaxID=1925666 RepID=UPI00273706D3
VALNGTGGTTPSVLLNDTVNGVTLTPATFNTVTLTTVGVYPTGITLNADGTVTVASGTASGSYDVQYQICTVATPVICDTTTVRIVVNTIDALNDTPVALNGTGGTTPSVLLNDTVNGVSLTPATFNTVTLTTVGVYPTGITLNADGTVTVAPGTASGSYDVQYQICTVATPVNCDIATVKVTVVALLIDAVNDTVGPINGLIGGNGGINVLQNDTFNGVAINPINVVISSISIGPLKVNANGTVTVVPGTPAGIYTVNYTICEILNPTNCDSASVTVTVINGVNTTDDEYILQNLQPLRVDIFANDNDVPTVGTITFTIPLKGSVNIDNNGTPNNMSDDVLIYTPNANYVGDDFFTYTICDSYGNCDTSTVNIRGAFVLSDCVIVFPGQRDSDYEGYAFTPNGDGVNDYFEIEFLQNCYPDYQIQIFNRYGNEVFEYKHNGNSSSIPVWWDGKSYGRMTINKGEILPVGTYYYILNLNKNNQKPVQGYIYLNK